MEHERENVIPGVEKEITQQGFQILEEGSASSQSLADGTVLFIHQIQDGMQQEGQQVE
jgi:hypothetical protein